MNKKLLSCNPVSACLDGYLERNIRSCKGLSITDIDSLNEKPDKLTQRFV